MLSIVWHELHILDDEKEGAVHHNGTQTFAPIKKLTAPMIYGKSATTTGEALRIDMHQIENYLDAGDVELHSE